MEKNEFARQN